MFTDIQPGYYVVRQVRGGRLVGGARVWEYDGLGNWGHGADWWSWND